MPIEKIMVKYYGPIFSSQLDIFFCLFTSNCKPGQWTCSTQLQYMTLFSSASQIFFFACLPLIVNPVSGQFQQTYSICDYVLSLFSRPLCYLLYCKQGEYFDIFLSSLFIFFYLNILLVRSYTLPAEIKIVQICIFRVRKTSKCIHI